MQQSEIAARIAELEQDLKDLQESKGASPAPEEIQMLSETETQILSELTKLRKAVLATDSEDVDIEDNTGIILLVNQEDAIENEDKARLKKTLYPLVQKFQSYSLQAEELQKQIDSCPEEDRSIYEKKAKELRREVKGHRTDSVRILTDRKNSLNAEKKALDAIKLKIESFCKPTEELFERIEKYSETKKQLEFEKKKADRLALCNTHSIAVDADIVAGMPDEYFESWLQGAINQAEIRKQKEAEEEKARIEEQERLKKLDELKDRRWLAIGVFSEYCARLGFVRDEMDKFESEEQFETFLSDAKAEHEKLILIEKQKREAAEKEAQEKQKLFDLHYERSSALGLMIDFSADRVTVNKLAVNGLDLTKEPIDIVFGGTLSAIHEKVFEDVKEELTKLRAKNEQATEIVEARKSLNSMRFNELSRYIEFVEEKYRSATFDFWKMEKNEFEVLLSEAKAKREQHEQELIKAEAEKKLLADKEAEAKANSLRSDSEKLELLAVKFEQVEIPELTTEEGNEFNLKVKELVSRLTGFIREKSNQFKTVTK